MLALCYSCIISHYHYEKLYHSVTLRVMSPQRRLNKWKSEYCPARSKLSKLLGVAHGESQASPDVSGNKGNLKDVHFPGSGSYFTKAILIWELFTRAELCWLPKPCSLNVGSCLTRGSPGLPTCLNLWLHIPDLPLGMGL